MANKAANAKLEIQNYFLELRDVRRSGDQEGWPEQRIETVGNEGGMRHPHCLAKIASAEI